MTYNVFGGMLNLAQSVNPYNISGYCSHCIQCTWARIFKHVFCRYNTLSSAKVQFMAYDRVLEKCFWTPGKFWKSTGILSASQLINCVMF